MPKVLSRTPDWLSRGAPGYSLFAANPQRKQTNGVGRHTSSSLPLRTLARRGTEVLTTVDNEIRWSDLVYLQELAQGLSEQESATAYKVVCPENTTGICTDKQQGLTTQGPWPDTTTPHLAKGRLSRYSHFAHDSHCTSPRFQRARRRRQHNQTQAFPAGANCACSGSGFIGVRTLASTWRRGKMFGHNH